jgi:branched-chain amino acid transport system permease protein
MPPRGVRLALTLIVLAVAATLPFVLTNFRLFQCAQVFIYAIALLGVNILIGFNGQFSLGHSAFYALAPTPAPS